MKFTIHTIPAHQTPIRFQRLVGAVAQGNFLALTGLSQVRTANTADLYPAPERMQLSAAITPNAADLTPVASGDWALISPYGDHPSPDGSYTQVFSREQADKVVKTWNSIAGIAVRTFKNIAHGLGIKSTAPVWDGHPETDKKRWPKEKLLAEISDLRAGEIGLEGKLTWNAKGDTARTRGPLFPSSLWWHWPASGTPPQVFPELLESVGLVPAPNISGVPAWTANTDLASSEAAENTETQKNENIMDKNKLIQLLGLAADATDEQIESALKLNRTTANTADQVRNDLTTANTTLDEEKKKVTSLNTANAAYVEGLLDLAEKRGVITAAQRGDYKDRLTTANTSAAAIKELTEKAPALNTTEVKLNGNRVDLSTANARATALEGLVAAYMKDHNCDRDKAYAAVQADPNNKPLFDAMSATSKA
ncbi:MAG: phage protease [Chthoniobacterales bacterium]